jgi:hypothetical protein
MLLFYKWQNGAAKLATLTICITPKCQKVALSLFFFTT